MGRIWGFAPDGKDLGRVPGTVWEAVGKAMVQDGKHLGRQSGPAWEACGKASRSAEGPAPV